MLKISKTIELRKLINSILKETNVNIFYERAAKEKIYPHIVYELESINFNYSNRDDIILTINIWDKNKDTSRIEVLADEVEKLFKFRNNPTDKILPTFYVENKKSIQDEDELIKRRMFTILIQNYYIGE